MAAVDELARVHVLGGDEELLLVLVPKEVGTATMVAVVVELGRDCNQKSSVGEPLSGSSVEFKSTLALFVMRLFCKR